MNNNKITALSLCSITLISFALFSMTNTDGIAIPKMDNEFQPILARNQFAFEKIANGHSHAIKDFDKTLPKSLEGIDLNIALPLDSDGNLIVGMELKDLFELYLSAMGEETLDDILLRIQNALAQQLTSPALEQGYDALKRFIVYKVELANLENQRPDDNLSNLENIRQQKHIVSAIQAEYFSTAEKEALFAAETEYDAFMLEHLTIQENNDLTLLEKQQQVEALAASLPEHIRVGRERAMAPAKIYLQAQQMKSAGHTEFDIFQMRADKLGEDAATALAQLDQDREQWQKRLAMFKLEYQSIIQSGLSEQDQTTAVSALLMRNFSDTESIRVRALTGL